MNKRNCLTAILHTALLVLLAAVVGVNIYAINVTRLAGDLVPMPFGFGVAVVLSGSMEPELSTGDLLLLVRQDAYYAEDVVVYQDKNMAVTHRIISISEEGVITKGDANNTTDSPISPAQIKGKVVIAIPLIGYLVNVIKSPMGTLTTVILALWLLERSFHLDKAKDDKKLDEIKAEIERLKQTQKDA